MRSICYGLNPTLHIVPRLATEEVRQLTKQLPRPCSVWKIQGAVFEVYKTKGLYDHQWYDNILLKLLIHARGSYYIYGDRPPLDEYDAKSVTYLVRARYLLDDNVSGSTFQVEEWLSDRLVPCLGDPVGGGELEYFAYQGKPMTYWLQERFGTVDHNIYTFSSNRMCTINPYYSNASDEKIGPALPIRMSFTAICYTLMRHHFFCDYLDRLGTIYKTSLLVDKVIEKSMSVPLSPISVRVEFTPAFKTMRVDPMDIKLFRTRYSMVPYMFPGYFLSASELVQVYRKLRFQGVISQESERYYVDEPGLIEVLNDSSKSVHFSQLKYIARMISQRGRIEGSNVTGEELRSIIDQEVSDAPELKISMIDELKKNCYQILSAVGAEQII